MTGKEGVDAAVQLSKGTVLLFNAIRWCFLIYDHVFHLTTGTLKDSELAFFPLDQ